MVMETGKHPGELKDSVCSPSGTTISAVYELEKAGFRFSLMNAVQAASKRAYELGLMDNYDTVSEVTGAAYDHQGRMNLMKSSSADNSKQKPADSLDQSIKASKKHQVNRSALRRSQRKLTE